MSKQHTGIVVTFFVWVIGECSVNAAHTSALVFEVTIEFAIPQNSAQEQQAYKRGFHYNNSLVKGPGDSFAIVQKVLLWRGANCPKMQRLENLVFIQCLPFDFDPQMSK